MKSIGLAPETQEGGCLGPCLFSGIEVPIKFTLISLHVFYLVRSSIFALPGLIESVVDSLCRLGINEKDCLTQVSPEGEIFHSPVSVPRVGSTDSDGLPCETRFEQSFINRLMRYISLARLPASIMSEGCILLPLTNRKILSDAFPVPLLSPFHIPLSKTSLKVSIIPAAFRCHSKLWVPPVHPDLCVLSPVLPLSCPSSLGAHWSPPSYCLPRFLFAPVVLTGCTSFRFGV